MDSFIFALSAVAPIIAMVAIGYFLKRIGWMNADFAKAANRLVFRVFMPVMLFVNIYKIESLVGVDLRYMLYSVPGSTSRPVTDWISCFSAPWG